MRARSAKDVTNKRSGGAADEAAVSFGLLSVLLLFRSVTSLRASCMLVLYLPRENPAKLNIGLRQNTVRPPGQGGWLGNAAPPCGGRW